VAYRIKPFEVPGVAVKPLDPSEGLRLTAHERRLFDSVSEEHIRISGTTVEYYHLDIAASNWDPLYGEARDRKFNGPYKIIAYLTYPESPPEMRQEGFRNSFNCECWISRKAMEDANAPAPSEGDVFRVWDLPYFNEGSVDGQNVPSAGYYFDATDVDEDGHLFDNPDFVGFKVTLARRNEFAAERRVGK